MKKYIILSLIVLFFSCKNGPERDKDIIDLEKFDLNFNVEEYYSEYIDEIEQTYNVHRMVSNDSILATEYEMIGFF